MKYLLSAGLILVLPALLLADGPTLKDARQRWLKGNYEEARSLYEEVGKDPKQKVAAAVGASKCFRSQGEYDKALAALDDALKDDPKEVELLAQRADLLYFRGRWDDAEKAANDALKIKDDNFLARWVLAQLYWDRGDLDRADKAYRWFVKTYTDRDNADMPIKDPDDLLLVGLAGVENARWHNLDDQFKFVLDDVYADALKADKDFWLSEYYAGVLLLEKYNRGEGLPALEKALTINPNAAEVLTAKGEAALAKFEVKEAEELADRALKINPNLPDALRLRADLLLAGGDTPAALRELENARKVNPRDEATLARVAACLFLQHKAKDFDAVVAEVEKNDPKAGIFYFELAERMDERRRFDEAEKYYKKSAELRPMLPWPNNSLGILYMRMGREKEARAVLDKAFKADPFNVRVSNTRKVLKHLDDYETLKTEHYEIRFDPKKDRVLAHYAADYLEEIYADLSEKFHYKPQGPILFEIFNSHEMFSGRVVALPDLHTIGACTGRMVAMASPHAKGVVKPFNWARVLRHEMVHIFNLEQSDMQVSHWFTEGLAVTNEGFPRPQQWNQLLLERVPKGELMTLDNIDLGFIRPRSPLDWYMAYCQSQLYVEFMKSKYGPQTVGQVLDAYRDGLETPEAIAKVCKVSKADFEKGYKGYLDDVVKGMKGKPAEKPLTYQELKKAHEDKPNDPDVTARLAEMELRRDKVKARQLAEEVLAKKKNHPVAAVVKARLLLQGGDADGAKSLLQDALDRNDPEPKVLRELGKIYYEGEDYAKAAELFELGRKAEPYNSEWLTELARVYAQTNERDKQIGVLKELVPTDADDLEHRKRLAKMLLESGKPAEAERYAREALEIDVKDAEAQDMLLAALENQQKGEQAAKLRKVLEK
jgi:tetratricopeptide (TPR) repeat protein